MKEGLLSPKASNLQFVHAVARNKARRNSTQDEMAQELLEEEAIRAQMEQQSNGIVDVVHKMTETTRSAKKDPSRREEAALTYKPEPLPLDSVHQPRTPIDFEEVAKQCAATHHDEWMRKCKEEGWICGPATNPARKTHMWMVPFDKLPGTMQQSNIQASSDTIKVLLLLRYKFQYSTEQLSSAVDEVTVPAHLMDVVEILAYHTHERWSVSKMKQGFTFGRKNAESEGLGKMTHPGLVPYHALSHHEQEPFRQQSLYSIKGVLASGWELQASSIASEMKEAAVDLTQGKAEFKDVFAGKNDQEALKVIRSVYVDKNVDVVVSEWDDDLDVPSRHASRLSLAMSYFFKNTSRELTAIATTDTDDETNWCTIAPGSRFTFFWNLVLMTLVTLTAIVTPYQLGGFGAGKDENTMPLELDVFVELVFLTDLVLNFYTGIVDKETDGEDKGYEQTVELHSHFCVQK